MQADSAAAGRGGQSVAEGHEPTIGGELRQRQLVERRERLGLLEQAEAAASLFKGIEVVTVDEIDMAQSERQRWKEADPLRPILGVRQLRAGAVQPVVRPSIVARHRADLLDRHRYAAPALARRSKACSICNSAGMV